jgi:hypothetical protein
MIGSERAAIFPLGVTDFVAMTDCDPSAFENGLTVTHERLLEPGNHLTGFGFCPTAFDIVVRQSNVKRILSRNEVNWNEISSGSGIRAIIASITIVPISIPGTTIIGDRIIAAWSFADPKDGGDDPKFPRVSTWSSTERCSPSH